MNISNGKLFPAAGEPSNNQVDASNLSQQADCAADYLSSLPSELILEIVKYIPDPYSLHNLFLASHTAEAVFNTYPVEITENVLAAEPQEHLRKLMQNCLTLYTTPPESIQKYLTDGTLEVHKRFPLPESCTTAGNLRKLLSTAANIQLLVWIVLKHFVDQVYASNPVARSGHALSPHARFRMSQGKSFSWLEQQRVLRALWRLQFFFDLQIIAPHTGCCSSRLRSKTRYYLSTKVSRNLPLSQVWLCLLRKFLRSCPLRHCQGP
ncbi:hypothetical protein K402DRAFT_165441 [Aulographum hederae CBS 113979]|uniref:F-box domain-containing protein n=1 Tax=Aulographum hederae CBS 113979 TaxID=1176131 RepID=A0A6G1GQZ6_9PEZI|nr:hypothetical protein K402DRAFT_165441 [Aulographum hederae CBS 113979]